MAQAKIGDAIRALVGPPSGLHVQPFQADERPTLVACGPLVSFLDQATRRPWLIVAMAVAFAVLCALGIWCAS